MKNVKLSAERRDETGKKVARKLRQNGKIPAVLYGREMDALHLAVDGHEAELLFYSIPVDNTIIELKVEGEKETFQTLVREIQTHPYRDDLVHVDFLRIQAGVMVDVNVPLHLVGEPYGVRENGGVLEQTIHDLPIKCIPSAIPESIELDVTELDLHDVLHVSDLKVGEGVEIQLPAERTVCSVAVPRAIIEEEEEEEVDEELLELEEGEEPPEGAEEPADDEQDEE
ncbi:MAG: 50S ribosomal protein L25 [Gemmatimonadota bacterium]|nr:50S ribosomal protein L25 [Gemmatimonadota bacterium]